MTEKKKYLDTFKRGKSGEGRQWKKENKKVRKKQNKQGRTHDRWTARWTEDGRGGDVNCHVCI